MINSHRRKISDFISHLIAMQNLCANSKLIGGLEA
jgi:hypothetical protein